MVGAATTPGACVDTITTGAGAGTVTPSEIEEYAHLLVSPQEEVLPIDVHPCQPAIGECD